MKRFILNQITLVILVISALNQTNLMADDVVVLKKNDPAPYDGLLFPPDKANDARKAVIERDSLKAINDSMTKANQLQQQNNDANENIVKQVMQKNDDLSKNLNAERTTTNWERVLWFGAGIVVTGLAFYGLHAISK